MDHVFKHRTVLNRLFQFFCVRKFTLPFLRPKVQETMSDTSACQICLTTFLPPSGHKMLSSKNGHPARISCSEIFYWATCASRIVGPTFRVKIVINRLFFIINGYWWIGRDCRHFCILKGWGHFPFRVIGGGITGLKGCPS